MANCVEADFGITQFLHKHKHFLGILKMRYQDFLVNEIDVKKTVLNLTSLVHEESPDDNVSVKVSLNIASS